MIQEKKKTFARRKRTNEAGSTNCINKEGETLKHNHNT